MSGAVTKMLSGAGLRATPNRRRVLEVLLARDRALSAAEILERAGAPAMDRATAYRILDVLVDRGLILRHSSGDRAWRYCLGGARSGRAHCHTYCRLCGRMRCCPPSRVLLSAGLSDLGEPLLADVERVEIRIDGVCAACRDRAGVDGRP